MSDADIQSALAFVVRCDEIGVLVDALFGAAPKLDVITAAVAHVRALLAVVELQREEMVAVLNEVQRHQPAGSPPPGGPPELTRWVLGELATDVFHLRQAFSAICACIFRDGGHRLAQIDDIPKAAEEAIDAVTQLREEVGRLRAILDAPVTALFADGREPTTNETHLLNLLGWRQKEAMEAKAEVAQLQHQMAELGKPNS